MFTRNTFINLLLFVAVWLAACDSINDVSAVDTQTDTSQTASESESPPSDTAFPNDSETADTQTESTPTHIDTPPALSVTAFQSSGGDNNSDAPIETYTGINATDYIGLSCIAWQFTENQLLLDLLNFRDGCSIEHAGEVLSAGGELHLQVTNPKCISTNCGNRFYSWSFEIQPVPETVTTIIAENTGCPSWDSAVSLEHIRADISDENSDSGMRCVYPSFGLFEFDAIHCGQLHQPCNHLADDTDDPLDDDLCVTPAASACEGDLVCVDKFEYPAARCVAPCETDADCPLAELLTCQEGLCLLHN